MLNLLVKFSAPLVLLSALFFLTGAVATAASMVVSSAAHCCDAAEEQPTQNTADDCTDHNCSCHCCNLSILTSNPFSLSVPQKSSGSQPVMISVVTADYIRAIDYPPEAL